MLLALRRVALTGHLGSADAMQRAARWLTGMQCRDGGWAAFDADNTRTLVAKLPFCDFGEVIDPPSADVTAHTIEALAAVGLAGSKAVRRGVVWLLRAQESDGSWFGRWGANYIYGTGAVVPALLAAGVLPGKPVIQRAIAWLTAHQNPDGGWGEDLRSYEDASWSGRGPSTASQTAWALLALLAVGPAAGDEVAASIDRGVRWLAETQRPDGSWDEPRYTGTGFPGDFYINYHLYRLIFPVSALGRFLGPASPAGRDAARPAGSGRCGVSPAAVSRPDEARPPGRLLAAAAGGAAVRRGIGEQRRGPADRLRGQEIPRRGRPAPQRCVWHAGDQRYRRGAFSGPQAR